MRIKKNHFVDISRYKNYEKLEKLVDVVFDYDDPKKNIIKLFPDKTDLTESFEGGKMGLVIMEESVDLEEE